MALTLWTNTMTGERLNELELATLRLRAHQVYEANTHIFEDESDALSALGAVPTGQLQVVASSRHALAA